MRKKIFRNKLNYDKAELRGANLHVGAIGVSLPKSAISSFEIKKDWLNLGSMWSSINDPKYYDNVTAHSIIPKEEDFIEQPFRLITATTVGGGTWKATDFSDAKILKKSMSKLDGKPVYKDHEMDLDNWAGIVKSTKWTKETVQNGVTVPAGIDGILAIDAKTNPKLARGILLGSVYSNSVTVDFSWEMSHNFENEYDFYNKVGTIGSDGKMVRRIVKEIHDYHETSMVWLGADPYAKAIQESGELKNIDTASIYEFAKTSFSKFSNKRQSEPLHSKYSDEDEIGKTGKKLKINFALDENVLSLTSRQYKQEPKTDDMDKILAAFILTFGKTLGIEEGTKLTEDELIAHFSKIKVTTDDEVTNLGTFSKLSEMALAAHKKDNPDAKEVDMGTFMKTYSFVSETALNDYKKSVEDKEALQKQVDNLKEDAELGKSYTKDKRDEAIRLYKATVGTGNIDESVVSLFEKADNKEVDGLLKQYTKTATGKFSGKCEDCGSSNFNFRSSYSTEAGKNEDDNNDYIVTSKDMRAEFDNPSMTIGQ